MGKLTSFFGSVLIPSTYELERTAEMLNAALDGFHLQRDESGDFEEWPAFVDRKASVELQLVGCLEGRENESGYSLTVRCVRIDPADLGARVGSKFLSQFPTDIPIEKNGYANLSQYLCEHIVANTPLECQAAWKAEYQQC